MFDWKGKNVVVADGPMKGNTGIVICHRNGGHFPERCSVKLKGYYNKASSLGHYTFSPEDLKVIYSEELPKPTFIPAEIMLLNAGYGICNMKIERYNLIKKVIFNAPATIVFWTDGSKTVVKASDTEYYDKEKGLAMCIAKKYLGNKGNYYNTFRKFLEENDVTNNNDDNYCNVFKKCLEEQDADSENN